MPGGLDNVLSKNSALPTWATSAPKEVSPAAGLERAAAVGGTIGPMGVGGIGAGG